MNLIQKIIQSIELLSEVIEKKGAYSQDHLQHAENVINNASKRAEQVTETLKEISGLLDETFRKCEFGCYHCSCCAHYHGFKKGCSWEEDRKKLEVKPYT